jgi:lipopolysaccharide biosynthesis protein
MHKRGLRGDIVVCRNRGRDVAPFFVETGKYLLDAELILHLHTKKSSHDDRYKGWGEFLCNNLIGSDLVVQSILHVFEQSHIGIVYSEHYPEVAHLRNWGYDFPKAQDLLLRIGVSIVADTLLEFPTGNMFWARREAISPLLECGLSYEHFDLELGQLDGTLAHAIERCVLYIAESNGYSRVKVIHDTTDQGLAH